jgi:hypothetical protein
MNALKKQNKIQKIENFGDVRQFLLETAISLRDGEMPVSTGMAIAANIKVMNDNIQSEINAAKLAITTQGTTHEFGRVVKLGRQLISDDNVID